MNGPAWRRSRVAADGTHHVVDGRPLYAARFLRALSFHEPGLAAVCDERHAWHINGDGRPAYPHAFMETFGFYENLAAVRDKNGWFHIRRDGASAYSQTHDWCGNFQGGRAVVRRDGGYFHILPDGRALYENRFLYAGDFRERRAVVRLADGLCAHISEDGGFAHPHRYRDLGVYHKGLACARDDGGWMHINADGVAVYERRFAQVEPFYNGCALVNTLDGKTEIIDESGRHLHTVMESPAFGKSENRDNLFQSLSADMAAYWKTYALMVMARIDAADKFPLRDEDAAGALGLPAENVKVFLHALAELDVVRRIGGEWRLTAKGEFMRPGHPFSLSAAAPVWGAFAESGVGRWLDALRGESEVDAFSAIADQPQKVTAMHRVLAAYAKHDYAALPAALPLAGISRLIDAGGGSGVAARLIANANKDINIVVLDRPEALALLEKEAGFEARISAHPCDIFAPWNLTADAVMLARVLHDWSDHRAMTILKNAHAALPPGGKIFIVERMKRHDEDHGLCSLHLLTVGGGRERALDEYRDLMNAASFRFLNARPLDSGVSILTGEAVRWPTMP